MPSLTSEKVSGLIPFVELKLYNINAFDNCRVKYDIFLNGCQLSVAY